MEYGGYDFDPVEVRVLTPEEAAGTEVRCAICGADLFPVNLGVSVLHDCGTGDVKAL